MPLIPTPNTVLRDLRESLGLTQEKIARLANIGLRTYQMLESGETRNPRESTLAGLYHVTGKTRREELGFHAQPLSPILAPDADHLVTAVAAALRGHTPASAAAMLTYGRTGRRIGTTELDRVHTRTDLLSGVYDQWGGGTITQVTLVDTMRHATSYLNGSFVSDRTHTDMCSAIANLSVAVARMFADQSAYAEAQTVLLIGLAATRDAGEERKVLRGLLLAQFIRQALSRRDLTTAHGLLDLADSLAVSQRLPVDVVALFTALRSGTSGTLGRLAETRDLAKKSLDLYATAKRKLIAPGEVTYEAGFGLACLELCAGLDVDNATAVLDTAIDTFSPAQVRQRTHARTFRLMTLTERGDATTALRDLAELRTDVDTLRSARIRESLALTHLVPRVVRGEPEAARVSSALHAYPAPIPPAFLRTHPSPTEVATKLHATSG